MKKSKSWWGTFLFQASEIKVWAIGDRKIAIQRKEKEWIVWNAETASENTSDIKQSSIKTTQTLKDYPFSRHLYTQTSENIAILPRLADRSIVAKPSSTLNIPSGEKLELYVSTPLWFCAKNTSTNSTIVEHPFWRPSDSWFGANTMEGDLCYAKNTDAKIDLALLEKRPHRAITAVIIENEHDETLTIDRMNIPVPYLTLYSDDENQFWTDQIEITHHTDNAKAGIEISNKPPSILKGKAELIDKPRIDSDYNDFVRSIKNLLG